MDMMNRKPEFIQQIQRAKFRDEQMNDLSSTWDHHNIRNPNNLGSIGILQNQISVPVQADVYQDCTTTFMNMPQPMRRDPQGSSNWRSSDSSSVVNYGYDQTGIRPRNVGDLFSNHFNVDRDTTVQSCSEISCLEDNQKSRVTNRWSLVTVACSGSCNEISKSSYDQGSSSGSYRGELLFLPSLGNQSIAHNASQWNHGSSCKEPLKFTATSHANKKGFSSALLSEIPKLSAFRDYGNAAVSSTVNVQRHLGPLGPFTGYASILKSSRFLEPAQKLLDEFCVAYGLKISRSFFSSMDDDDSSTDHVAGESSSSSEPLEPKNRLKRANLLFLQEEVCKMYKVYNHQLQTVVSSFELVAGLSTATPYISFALGRISKSFKALRASISEQLKQISSQYSLGGGNNEFQKQQRFLIDNNVGIGESQQHYTWRPQRGLPERAVVVLRAWLFDHFLHPYPTDSDKQMLASQTGLSRNQVSNWFINARVRLWKPMVEEMHMLDTKDIKNADTVYDMEPSNRPNVSSQGHGQTLMDLPGTKRSRLEFNKGLGNVSLTLGLRYGMDNVTQTQTQTPDHQFGGGGQMFHDFVG